MAEFTPPETSVPPFPSESTTISSLLRHLGSLRAWVLEQQDALADELNVVIFHEHGAGREEIAKAMEITLDRAMAAPAQLETETILVNAAVVTHYAAFSVMRQVRESFDAILREYEDCWQSKTALRARCNIILLALACLQNAFLSPEASEMQADKARQEIHRMQHKLSRAISKLAGDEKDSGDEEEDDSTPEW